MDLRVKNKNKSLNGEIIIPSDKSMSHRAVLLSSLAKGKSVIRNFSNGYDPMSSLNICRALGVKAEFTGDKELLISSTSELIPSEKILDCGNSGTTMRLMAGILAGQNFDSMLVGDSSLSKRPMKRIITPLELMGAKIESNNFCAPLKIYASKLHSIYYESPLSSAQVKSCVLLAGLKAEGITSYKETFQSRNHTEIMLSHMGANIRGENGVVYIQASELEPLDIKIFGDISSAAYFIAAGLIVPDSKIIIKNVGLNPTRTGILKVVEQMGYNVELLDIHTECGELVGDIKVEYCDSLKGCEISKELIPTLIDEIPIIALIASQAEGETVIKDAADLHHKESDRIKTTVEELKKLGVDIVEADDGMIIKGKTDIQGGVEVDSHKDHRLAMTLYVAGLIARKEISIKNFEWVNISFPEFEGLMEQL